MPNELTAHAITLHTQSAHTYIQYTRTFLNTNKCVIVVAVFNKPDFVRLYEFGSIQNRNSKENEKRS